MRLICIIVSLVFACSGWSQSPTLIPGTPKILKTSAANPNDGAVFNVVATSGGTVLLSLTQGTRSLTADVGLRPPAELEIRDQGNALFFNTGFADFTGTADVKVNTNAGTTWEAVSNSILCGGGGVPIESFGNVNGTPNARFLCRVGSLQVETVDGVRQAYFDANVTAHFDYNRDNPAARTATVRFYFKYGAVTVRPELRIIQVTQDFAGSVPLIAGKGTVALVFARQTDAGPTTANITAKLHAWVLDKKDGQRVRPLGDAKAPQGTIASAQDPNPNQPGASLVFQVPAEWTTTQFLEVGAELVVPGNTDANGPTLSQKVEFLPSFPFRIVWFPMSYLDGMGQVQRVRNPNQSGLDAFIKKVYPVLSKDVHVDKIEIGDVWKAFPHGVTWNKSLNAPESRDLLKATVTKLTSNARIAPHDMAFALLPATAADAIDPEHPIVGFGDAPFLGGKGKVMLIVETEPLDTQQTIAHEAAHNLGLRHTNTDGPRFDNCGFAKDKTREWEVMFHYNGGTIQEPGFDTAEMALKPQRLNYDLMAYCPPDKTWIAPEHYKQLVKFRPQPSAGGNEDRAGQANRAAQSEDYLIINGSVERSGTGGTLEPALRVATTDPADTSDPNGSHCLVSTAPSGEISRFCFTPVFLDTEDMELNRRYFSYQIRYAAGLTRLALVYRDPQRGDVELTTITGGGGPPSIVITSPGPGDRLAGTVAFRWNGSDPVNLPLSYYFDYSYNGGASWVPITLEPLTDGSADIDTSQIVGGDQMMFRVTAMNGLETATATVGPLSLAQSPRMTADRVVDFGETPIGQTYTADLSLSNSGSGPYIVNSVSIDNPDFQTSVSFPMHVWPDGGPLTIPIAFRPSTGGTVRATLTINNETTVTLTARVMAPAISVPAQIDFGAVAIGQLKTLNLTIRNTGSASLNVSAVSLTGSPAFRAANFSPTAIAAGSSIDVPVTFQPSAPGSATGSVTIASDDPLRPTVTVTLAGSGSAQATGRISLSTQSLAFGTLAQGQTAATLRVTITNIGQGDLRVSSAMVSGDQAFTVTPAFAAATLAPGRSTDVNVQFSPAAAGNHAATLRIASDDPSSPAVAVELSATVTASPAGGGLEVRSGNPLVVVTSLDFGTVATGQSKDFVVRVINNGPVGGTITSTFSNTKFSQVGATSVQAGPFGGYNDVTIRFSPSDTSAQTGTWTLSGVGLTTTIALTGNSGGGTTGGGGGSACVAPATNLVSWWSGDGNANDLTGGNNGTALGGLTYTTGKVGQAFQINGSTSYVSIGNPTNLRPTSALTMNAWINPAVAPTGSNLMAIITKWGQTAGTTPDADSFGMWLQQNGTSLSVYAAVHLSGGTNEPRALGGNVPLNAWSHVAMTFDGSNVIAYVNGQLVNTFPAAGSIISSSRNVLIGREDSSLPRAFNGAIDEVQMLNRALTAAEIQAIYNAGANGVCKTGGSTGGGTTTGTILQVDDGREEYTFGTEQGGPIYFVNRLTPTRYPATLRAVQILFPTGELAAGSAVAVLSSQNAGSSGGPQLAGLVFVRSNGTVTSQGTFLEFAVAPMTIQSGDFVVGFSTVAPPNVFPGAVDSSSGSKQRSYVSSTGSTFTLLDSITGLVPGNLLIRAKID